MPYILGTLQGSCDDMKSQEYLVTSHWKPSPVCTIHSEHKAKLFGIWMHIRKASVIGFLLLLLPYHYTCSHWRIHLWPIGIPDLYLHDLPHNWTCYCRSENANWNRWLIKCCHPFWLSGDIHLYFLRHFHALSWTFPNKITCTICSLLSHHFSYSEIHAPQLFHEICHDECTSQLTRMMLQCHRIQWFGCNVE